MGKIRTDATVFVWLALGLLLLPFSWLFAAAVAAVIHELGHLVVSKIRKVPWEELKIGAGGMVIHMGTMTEKDTLLIALAGPGASLLLCSLLHVWPQAAICGLVQGVYNLLPIYPLDGGRVLHALIGDRAASIEKGFIIMILIAGIVGTIRTELGISPLLLALLVCIRAIQRKFPCKEGLIGVQ